MLRLARVMAATDFEPGHIQFNCPKLNVAHKIKMAKLILGLVDVWVQCHFCELACQFL